MADTSILNQVLPASDNPGLETLDPRFQEIVSLVENNDFLTIATLAENLFNENIFDIRVIGYYLQAVYLEHGLTHVSSIFVSLEKIFNENWTSVGPVQKKEKHTQRILSWLFSQLSTNLQYHIEQNDEVVKKWLQELNLETIQNIQECAKNFEEAMASKVDSPDTLESLGKIKKYLEDLAISMAPPPSEPESKVAEEKPQESIVSSSLTTSSIPTTSTGLTIEASYPLQMLMEKISAFNKLVEKQQFNKAAIIADDVNAIIANFDPRIYFPKTFAQYYKQLSGSIESIAPYWDSKESLPWQMMSQFYKVDLENFVEGS